MVDEEKQGVRFQGGLGLYDPVVQNSAELAQDIKVLILNPVLYRFLKILFVIHFWLLSNCDFKLAVEMFYNRRNINVIPHRC